MRYCVADVDEDFACLLELWASALKVSTPYLFLMLVERSRCPIEIYDSGVLVARSAIYQGV